MLRLRAAAGFALALLMAPVSARAQDGWEPFKERDQARGTQTRGTERAITARQQEPPSESQPPLPPMGGVDTRPWLDEDAVADDKRTRHPGPSAPRYYRDDQPAPWQQPPRGADRAPAESPATGGVERSDLQPLPPIGGGASRSAPADAGVSTEFWQGLDTASVSELIAPLSIPPKSAALARLWHRLLSSSVGPPVHDGRSGSKQAASFDALRLEALYRSGFIAELRELVGAHRSQSNDPVESLLIARTRIGLGEQEAGCAAIKGLQQAQSSLPKPARQDFLLLAALCGVGKDDAGKASLAADLLRAEGVSDSLALASLDALASGNPASFRLPPVKSVSLLDYRFLELVGAEPPIAGAEPAFLAIAAGEAKDPAARILAAEAALSLHAITPIDLAKAYRSASFSGPALAQPFAEHQPPPLQRALLFQAFEAERTPLKEARFARALLDEIRRANGPYMQVAALLAPAVAELRPAPNLRWFAETAIEIGLAGNRIDSVRDWISAPDSNGRQGQLDHWLVLADIAAPTWHGRRGASLPAAERRAVGGELAPELMHRLVTVLDALDYQIPIPLWEAASRTQQPTSGYLPETGVLSDLQKASQQREQGRTVLLAMRALGPESGDSAHMIALGDTVRALKRVGLDVAARQLGLEALFMAWPRSRID